ncbi:erbin isoform X2 [Cryptotermes secundus]|uniref:erbin isoform X2 n=1 Tax=Cryptotermes secundus TaxID=105785 RepID=UPI000CD7D8B9|nr:erbin isoform X2 [Cryptotermes secundus]
MFIGNLKKLTHFDASTNNIKWVAPEIGSCCCLTDLTLSCNEITEIPESIGNLKQLVTLKLDENQLTALPNTIGKLSSLEEFILSQNDFETLPPCIGLLRKLNILNGDDNLLEELPPEIGSCTSLTILSVRNNKLQEVPAELGHLPNIRVMNFSDNQLRNLPVSILNLTFLTALWLSNNQSTPLTTLQQDVDKVTGQTVCINFMLPQSSQELCLAENRNELEADVRCSPKNLERPHIRFAADAESEVTGHLVRAPTPYPKELRAMAKHARSFQQQHTRRASRESDGDVPLLDEMVSPGPKGVLIKEAKVKKPSTVPLVNPVASSKNKENEEDSLGQNAGNSETASKYKSANICTDETSPVLASDSGPVIREAKYVRQVTNMAEEREKFFRQREEVPSISMPLESSSTVTDSQRSPLAMQKTVIESPRPSITTEQPHQQPQPPPYHIAAAYSKQAAYFQVRSASPAAAMSPQTPVPLVAPAKEVLSPPDVSISPEHAVSNYKEPLNSAPKPSVLLKSVAEKSSEKTDEGDSSRERVESPEEESGTQKVEDTQTVSHFEHQEENKGNDDVSIPIGDMSSRRETGNKVITKTEVQDAPVDESEVPIHKTPSFQGHSDSTESKEANISTFVNATPIPSSSIPSLTSVRASKAVNTTVTVASTSAVTSTTSPVATVALTMTTENSVAETENKVSDARKDMSGPTVGSPQGDDAKNTPLSPKCRIPVRLGDPVCLKSSTQEADDLLNKPSTCTEDKPSAGDSVCAPAPQQPACSSPTSVTPVSSKYVIPKSPTSASRTGTKIPSLLPSVSHGLAKGNITSQPQNNAPSLVEKISSPNSKFPSPSASLNRGRPDVSASSVLGNSWSSSVSEAESLSDSGSGTRIPQPAFYSTAFSLQSPKRGSFSSQSSSSSRPGSIAPLLNTSLDSSASPIMKEAGYNYINKPRFSATDHNLNISSKIPTAMSPSSSQLSPLSGYSSLEGTALHGNSKSALSNEQSPLASKIPTLSSTPTSPSSARLGSMSQRLFSAPAAESSQRTSLESPGRQAKTWMFGPHKNATVFPVVIKKNPGLGFSITGGHGFTSPLEKHDNEGIFVTKVHPNGPASSCLLPGDKILEVDGTDFTKVEHDQAVGILKQTGSIVNMMISRQQ